MKNRFLVYFIVYVVIIFLTGIFNRYMKFLGAAPEFFLIFLVLLSLRLGPRFGAVFGFFSGLFLDFTSIFLVGSQCLIFTTIGYVCGLLSGWLYVSQLHNQIIVISTITLIRFALNFFLGEVFGVRYSPGVSWLILTLLYNILVFPMVFNLLKLPKINFLQLS